MVGSEPKNMSQRRKKSAKTYYDRLWVDVAEITADLANVAIDDMEHQFKKQRVRDVYLELREVLKQLGVY
jgi:hypothetical protein